MQLNPDRQVTPVGYAETMDALNRPNDWDVPGMIADVAEFTRRELDVPHGQALAVIDTLTFRMRDIANLIHPDHAKRIDHETIRQAAEIAARFCDKPDRRSN